MLIMLTFRFMPRRTIKAEWRSSANLWMQRWSEPDLESCLILQVDSDGLLVTCYMSILNSNLKGPFLIDTCHLCFYRIVFERE